MWTDARYDANHHGTICLKKLFDGQTPFKHPKSLFTLLDIIKLTTDKNDIVLDFFAGSGTTGHAVLELNKEDDGDRQFILVEQLEEHVAVCKERLEKVMKQDDMKTNFISCEMKTYNEAFMERIQSAESTDQLLEIWREMPRKSILNWYINPKAPEKAEAEFIALEDLDKQKQELAKQLDKNQLYVNLSEIADETFEVSELDVQLNAEFYATNGDVDDE